MQENDFLKIMNSEEKIDLALRSLYSSEGYKQFFMGKFEEYDLYVRNRDFIPSEDIITLTGRDGKLLALRPDISLSIVKNYRGDGRELEKNYYSETVYRADKSGGYKAFRQTGLECLGSIDEDTVSQVLILACRSLETISRDFVIEISHIGFLRSILRNLDYDANDRLLYALSRKNRAEIEAACMEFGVPENVRDILITLTETSGEFGSIREVLSKFDFSPEQEGYISQVEEAVDALRKAGFGDKARVDFSIVNNMSYYSGILFRGYIKGVARGVLSGGRYDGLMSSMNKKGGAIGFAVYLDFLDQIANSEADIRGTSPDKEGDVLRVALPKGRLGQKVYDIFARAGYPCPEMEEDSRRLVFTNEEKGISYFWVKPSDVTVYVERGAADIGACGNDIIMEYSPDIYELLDLNIGKCKICVAGPKGDDWIEKNPVKVATKFPEIAKGYFAGESRDIDIIGLNGSIELAPILGLSDVIVDIVETGATIRENNLEVKEEICDISARIIANKAMSKFKKEKIREAIGKLSEVIE